MLNIVIIDATRKLSVKDMSHWLIANLNKLRMRDQRPMIAATIHVSDHHLLEHANVRLYAGAYLNETERMIATETIIVEIGGTDTHPYCELLLASGEFGVDSVQEAVHTDLNCASMNVWAGGLFSEIVMACPHLSMLPVATGVGHA